MGSNPIWGTINLGVMEDKRLEQKREAWIKNVMKVQDFSRENAESLYDKIKPYKIEVDHDINGNTVIKGDPSK